MTGDGTPDRPAVDADGSRRWDDAVEWTVDSAAALWSAWKRFVRAQLRSPKKLIFWFLFMFGLVAFVGACLTIGTASEPARCEGMQAILESDCG